MEIRSAATFCKQMKTSRNKIAQKEPFSTQKNVLSQNQILNKNILTKKSSEKNQHTQFNQSIYYPQDAI